MHKPRTTTSRSASAAPRPASSPAYYLGHAADAWLDALRPRRRRRLR